ncbi:MAG: ketopantoate reductase family protein [Sphingomonadales bacterium]
MRIAIMGAGGVGGYYGAALAKAGADVGFIARGAHLDAMRRRGLTVLSDNGAFKVDPVRASADAASIGPVDVVLFCVKLYDTEQAVRACRPLIGDTTIVVTLQNGVESVAVLSAILGPGRVAGGAVYIVSRIESPGIIRRTGPSDLMEIGVPEGGPRDGAEAFVNMGRGAGLNISLVDDMNRMIWGKFILLSASSAMTALTRATIGEVRGDPVMRGVMIKAIQETVRVAHAVGVCLPDGIEKSTLYRLDTVLAADAKASQLVDLERGRRLELEWLSGAIHRLGREAGIETPVHSTVYAALKRFAAGAVRP